MTFQNYNSSNNANALLDSPITETSTTLNLKGAFGRFPTSNFIVSVKEKDIEGNVIFRENMLISTRSGNVCNIATRKVEPVPQTDDSTTNVQESYPFSTDSEVEVVISSLFMKDIQDENERLENDKLNKWGLRTALANTWKMFFSNGSNNETELSLGASWTYLKSNGASSAPEWSNPPLDINGQTTVTTSTTSFFVALYNGSSNVKTTLANLVKGLGYATTSQQWVVELATDAEAITWTSTTLVPNLKQIWFNIVPWNATLAASTANISFSNTTYEKKKEILVTLGWTYRVDFNITNANLWAGHNGYWRIYVNWIAVWTERNYTLVSSTALFTENFTVSAWDLVQLYMRIESGRWSSSNDLLWVYYTTASKLPTWTVNL